MFQPSLSCSTNVFAPTLSILRMSKIGIGIGIVCKALVTWSMLVVKSSQINGQTWSYWWSWDVRGSADPVPDAKSISRRAKNLPKTGLRPDYELSDSFSLSPANQQLMRTPQQSFTGKRRNDRGTTKGMLMWMKIAPKSVDGSWGVMWQPP